MHFLLDFKSLCSTSPSAPTLAQWDEVNRDNEDNVLCTPDGCFADSDEEDENGVRGRVKVHSVFDEPCAVTIGDDSMIDKVDSSDTPLSRLKKFESAGDTGYASNDIFTDFDNIRVLNITHDDLDGAVSEIVIRNVYPNCTSVPTSHGGSALQVGIDAVNAGGYDAIVFTDFGPNNPALYEAVVNSGKPFLVLDHHQTAEVREGQDNGIYVIDTSKCGSLLALDYFSRYKDLEYLRELCVVTDDHDRWIRKIIPLSDRLNNLMYEMGFDEFVKKYMHGMPEGKLFPEDEELLAEHDREVRDYVDHCPKYGLPHNGLYIECDRYNSDINLMFTEKFDWLVMAGETPDGLVKLSFRTKRKDLNLGLILKSMGLGGGGHPGAAGQTLPPEQVKEFLGDFVKIAFGD